MAVKVMIQGDLEIQIKEKTYNNIDSLVVDGALTAADYPHPGGGLSEFRELCNGIFSQFNTDVTVADLVTLGSGDSWLDVRDKLNTNFELVDAVINP